MVGRQFYTVRMLVGVRMRRGLFRTSRTSEIVSVSLFWKDDI